MSQLNHTRDQAISMFIWSFFITRISLVFMTSLHRLWLYSSVYWIIAKALNTVGSQHNSTEDNSNTSESPYQHCVPATPNTKWQIYGSFMSSLPLSLSLSLSPSFSLYPFLLRWYLVKLRKLFSWNNFEIYCRAYLDLLFSWRHCSA